MTEEIFQKAEELMIAIDYMGKLRRRIENDEVFKKNAIDRESIVTAARDAMLAVVDEETEALKDELGKL